MKSHVNLEDQVMGIRQVFSLMFVILQEGLTFNQDVSLVWYQYAPAKPSNALFLRWLLRQTQLFTLAQRCQSLCCVVAVQNGLFNFCSLFALQVKSLYFVLTKQ